MAGLDDDLAPLDSAVSADTETYADEDERDDAVAAMVLAVRSTRATLVAEVARLDETLERVKASHGIE